MSAVVAFTAIFGGAIPSAASQSGAAAPCLCGKVTDLSGSPLSNVELDLVTSAVSVRPRALTRSNGDGSFSLKRPPGGTGELRLRRLGYIARSVAILFDTLTPSRLLTVTLEPAPVELVSVKVAAPLSLHMRDFNERRRKRGTGYFIDRAEIEKKRPAYTSDLLRSLPGMSVRVSMRVGGVVRVRGCRPAIFLDGIQVVGAELDDVTRPGDIDALEIYSSWSAIPPQFNDRQGGKCGAIIVWTRIQ